jgi:hypothetical protein
VVAELRGLRSDFGGLRGDLHVLAARLEANEAATAKAAGVASAAAAAATQAYDQATAAMRATSEVKAEVDDAKAAMIRHAAAVSKASTDIVAANAAQTPLIEQTLAMLKVLKKNGPAIAAAIATVAVTLATIVGQAVNAYLRAKGHG